MSGQEIRDIQHAIAPREVGRLLGQLAAEGTRGHDELDFRPPQAGQGLLASEGEIQVHRHLVGEETAEIGDRRRDARRQDDRDTLCVRASLQFAGESPGQRQQGGAAEFSTRRGPVDQSDRPALLRQAFRDLAAEMPVKRSSLRESLRRQLQQTQAGLGVLGRGKRLTDHDCDGSREMLGQLPERLAAAEAQDRTPHAVDRHRHDGRAAAAGDQLEAFAQLHEAAVTREAALGEDADHFAARERLS